jgi:hypothetical protein
MTRSTLNRALRRILRAAHPGARHCPCCQGRRPRADPRWQRPAEMLMDTYEYLRDMCLLIATGGVRGSSDVVQRRVGVEADSRAVPQRTHAAPRAASAPVRTPFHEQTRASATCWRSSMPRKTPRPNPGGSLRVPPPPHRTAPAPSGSSTSPWLMPILNCMRLHGWIDALRSAWVIALHAAQDGWELRQAGRRRRS